MKTENDDGLKNVVGNMDVSQAEAVRWVLARTLRKINEWADNQRAGLLDMREEIQKLDGLCKMQTESELEKMQTTMTTPKKEN